MTCLMTCRGGFKQVRLAFVCKTFCTPSGVLAGAEEPALSPVTRSLRATPAHPLFTHWDVPAGAAGALRNYQVPLQDI